MGNRYSQMLKQVRRFLDANYKKREEQRKEIKKVLHKLKKRERELKDRLKDAGKSEARELREDIELIHAQRKKGLKVLKGMKD